MSKYQSVRGTRDLLPELKAVFRKIDKTAFETAQYYGYTEIETPIFEFSDVFHRSLGETSDAVSKETYTFTDRGGDSITLRPEGTAGVVRAFVSEGLAQKLPLKLYYYGPMFRYERPQKGRYRQFYQFGVEVLGLENPMADVECLSLAWSILGQLGLRNRCQLEINTLGDPESRAAYKDALVKFLTPLKDQLSEDSKVRLEKNPMRILDSKDEGDKKLVSSAPKMSDFLNDKSLTFYTEVLAGLDALGIPYLKNEKLVRGLDYYCHTVFEFVTTELGSQGAILSGGRYDGLVETLGGAKTSGVGWASGVDRLADLVTAENAPPFILDKKPFLAFIAQGEKALQESVRLAHVLREKLLAEQLNKNNITIQNTHRLSPQIEVYMTGNISKKLEKASKKGFSKAVLIFEQQDGLFEYKLRDMDTKSENRIDLKSILELTASV